VRVAEGKRYRAVLLDVGGTLIEARPSPAEVYAEVLSRWGPPVRSDEVDPAFRRAWQELTQTHPPGLDRYHQLKGGEWAWWGTLLRRVLAEISHPAPWEPVLEELFTAFSKPDLWYVFPEVHEVLAFLRGRDLRLGVVSNWDSRLPALLDRLELTRHFDVVMVSALEGVEKPAPEIFLRAAELMEATPAHCLHVGDSPLDDVRGAESAGMDAVLVDRGGVFADGYRRIRDLRGLYELF
jgi:putative hydrolase of the HAD superfamily